MRNAHGIFRSMCLLFGLVSGLSACGPQDAHGPPEPIGSDHRSLWAADSAGDPDATPRDGLDGAVSPWRTVIIEELQAGAGPCADCLTLGARLGMAEAGTLRTGSAFTVVGVSARGAAFEAELRTASLIWYGPDAIDLAVRVEGLGDEPPAGARWSLSFIAEDADGASSHELTLRPRVGGHAFEQAGRPRAPDGARP